MSRFREISISGSARQRGLSHGEQLRGEIAQSLSFYRDIFRLPEATVLEQARHFQKVIADFNDAYAAEIEAIAEGAGQDPLWVVALNARTEILALSQQAPVNECTSIGFAGTPLLGQTWDWGQSLEELCALFRISYPDGHQIRLFGEPGIIGKIGMNSAGLGVCLNILTLGSRLDGVPVHVLLRGILDCRSIEEASALIASATAGKSSHILVGDRSGRYLGVEFAGDESFRLGPDRGVYAHSNHYLGSEINAPDDPLFLNSRARLKQAGGDAVEISDVTVEKVIGLLSDRSHAEFPVFRSYLPDEALKQVGTVATIVMDLAAGEFHIRKGNDPASPFSTFA